MVLRAGMYSTFLDDWFQVFPREQFLIIKAEDYYTDRSATLVEAFRFLGVQKLSREDIHTLSEGVVVNARNRSLMFDETRRLLDDFYRPHNLKLSELLNDARFSWS